MCIIAKAAQPRSEIHITPNITWHKRMAKFVLLKAWLINAGQGCRRAHELRLHRHDHLVTHRRRIPEEFV